MFCPQCGAENPTESAFCKECGTKLTAKEETPQAGGASDDSAGASMSARPSKGKDLPKKPLIIGAAVAVVALVAFVAFGLLNSGPKITVEQLERDIVESHNLPDGFVSSNYVEDSPYELTSLEIESVEEAEYGDLSRMETYDVVAKGVLANDSFESAFTLHTQYGRFPEQVRGAGEEYYMSGTCEFVDVETKPLKGVDSIGIGVNDNFTLEINKDLEVTFDEKDGVYTSVASTTDKTSAWFVEDTADVVQSFTFDPENGWVPDGDVKMENQKTEWKIAGKTFNLTDYPQDTNTDGSVVSAITFDSISEDGQKVEATYTYDYTTTEESVISSNFEYHDVKLSGKLTGTINRTFGGTYAEIVLKDEENSVSFSLTLDNSDASQKAKSMSASMESEAIVLTRGELFDPDTYDADHLTYSMGDAGEADSSDSDKKE